MSHLITDRVNWEFDGFYRFLIAIMDRTGVQLRCFCGEDIKIGKVLEVNMSFKR